MMRRLTLFYGGLLLGAAFGLIFSGGAIELFGIEPRTLGFLSIFLMLLSIPLCLWPQK